MKVIVNYNKMVKQEIFHTTITQPFQPHWKEFHAIIDADEEFQRIMKEKATTNKKYLKESYRESAKIRYAILFFNKTKKAMKNKEVGTNGS